MSLFPLVRAFARRRFVLIGLSVIACLGGCHDAPAIPHPVSSTDDEYCRKCHTGRADVGRIDHLDKDACTSCHKVSSTGQYPSAVPHPSGETSSCAMCHGDGAAGASVVKHLDEQDCFSCHEATERGVWPPNAPHSASSPQYANCLSCHGQIDHVDGAPCSQCHQFSPSG